jgi:hypothetical protein
MTDPRLDPGTRPSSSLPAPVRLVLRLLAAVTWAVLGLFAYFVCQGMFGGYQDPLEAAHHPRHGRHRPDRRDHLDRGRATPS